MRVKNILSIGLIVLWAGCAGGRPYLKRGAYADPCTDDTDCDSRFCTNGRCIRWGESEAYGHSCKPPDKDLLPEDACGDGYLCVDGRCRSCLSDDDCTAYFGVGKCVPVHGATKQMGYGCFPNTTRRTGGVACDKDEQCRTDFCDRGRCTAAWEEMDNYTYGLACVPWRVPTVPDGFDHVKECSGYLCIEQRCRSCVSDEECQRAGVANAKCMALTKLSGKVCATPEMIASGRLNGPPPSFPDDAGVVLSIPP